MTTPGFVRSSGVTVFVLALALAVASASVLLRATRSPSPDRYQSGPCATATATAVLAPASEPGTRLVVHGRLFEPDGVTPARGVIVYAYQTDNRGLYNDSGKPPRLRGWVRTAPDGTFTLDTIRPASYPNGRIAAHIHIHAWGAGHEPQYNREVLFADDPYLSDREREQSKAAGTFAFIQAAETRGGVLHVTQSFRLKPAGDRFEDNIRHGLAACEVAASR